MAPGTGAFLPSHDDDCHRTTTAGKIVHRHADPITTPRPDRVGGRGVVRAPSRRRLATLLPGARSAGLTRTVSALDDVWSAVRLRRSRLVRSGRASAQRRALALGGQSERV